MLDKRSKVFSCLWMVGYLPVLLLFWSSLFGALTEYEQYQYSQRELLSLSSNQETQNFEFDLTGYLIATHFSYDPLGRRVQKHYSEYQTPSKPGGSMQIKSLIRYQGQYFNEDVELHYNRFRYYDPLGLQGSCGDLKLMISFLRPSMGIRRVLFLSIHLLRSPS